MINDILEDQAITLLRVGRETEGILPEIAFWTEVMHNIDMTLFLR